MQKFNNKIIIIITIIIFCIFGGVFICINKNNKNEFLNEFNGENIEVIDDNKIVKEKQDTEDKEEDFIYVHIIGEVNNCGLIKLKEGARIIDAIDAAGGITENADLNKVNLAFILSDGCKLKIPKIGEENEKIISTGDDFNIIQDGLNIASGGKVNINLATQSQLETVTGIGPSTAAKIIEYRKQNGKFNKIEDIKNVSGIGEEKFNNIKNQICVK